jgi:hypothetical protein
MEEHNRVPRKKANKEIANLQCTFRVERWKTSTSGSASTTGDPGPLSNHQEISFRPRKAHKKSRSGCQNCKKRRIKVSLSVNQSVSQSSQSTMYLTDPCKAERTAHEESGSFFVRSVMRLGRSARSVQAMACLANTSRVLPGQSLRRGLVPLWWHTSNNPRKTHGSQRQQSQCPCPWRRT